MLNFAMSWELRLKLERRARNLTKEYENVLRCLATFRGRDGAIFPSHAAIAQRAECSVRTVQRALVAAARSKLVHWLPRRRRVGWRSLRDSNRYFLNVPAAPVVPGLRPPFPRSATGGQPVREQDRIEKKERKEASQGATWRSTRALVKVDLLAERRKVIEARLLASYRPFLEVGRL